MSQQALTILVADDHPMFRAAAVHMSGMATKARVLEAASQSSMETILTAEPKWSQAISYETFYRPSIEQPDSFWAKQALRIHGDTFPTKIFDQSPAPFRRCFAGGTTNLCCNAVDRHLAARGDQRALVAISTETDSMREFTYCQLYREVNVCAAVRQSLNVRCGDRVVIYMPNVAEAVRHAGLLTHRCDSFGGFGGFSAHNLALLIDDAEPKLLIDADAGMRGGNVIPCKALVDAAMSEAARPP